MTGEPSGPMLRIDVACHDVWREISNYIDDDVTPELRAAIERHLAECRPCMAVLRGAQNLVNIVGDPRAFQVPTDFSQRIHARIQRELTEEKSRVADQYAR